MAGARRSRRSLRLQLADLGFKVLATGGTQRFLVENGVAAEKVNKVLEGRPHTEDAIRNPQGQLGLNTHARQPAGPGPETPPPPRP